MNYLILQLSAAELQVYSSLLFHAIEANNVSGRYLMGDFKIRIKYNQDNGKDSTKKERIVLLKYQWKEG